MAFDVQIAVDCAQPHVRRTLEIARWPALAYPWLPAAQRKAAAIPPLAAGCPPDALASMQTLRIDGVGDGTRLARPPNGGKPPRLRLRAIGTEAPVRWLVNGRLAGETRGSGTWSHAFDSVGEQRITALADSGAWAELTLQVVR